MKSFINKFKLWIVDHYHILFKSAALNHLRIQELLKNPDGTYQLTVKFNSYSELKNYQKKLRRMTISLSSAVAMVIVAFIVAPYIMNPNRSSASTFLWTQTKWETLDTNNTTGTTQYPNDGTWNKYKESNPNIVASANGVTLKQPEIASVGDNTYAGDPKVANDPNLYLSNSIISLKKPAGAACSVSDECMAGTTCLTGLNKCLRTANFSSSTTTSLDITNSSFIIVDMAGAVGGGSGAGKGGRVQTTLSVTPGDRLDIYAGNYGTPGTGQFSGGKASAILKGTTVLAVAGGGGGDGDTNTYRTAGTNGVGGCSNSDGTKAADVSTSYAVGGSGGIGASLSAVGAGGAGGTGVAGGASGTSGVLNNGGNGGNGGFSTTAYRGGGGGSGYFGGGGGGGGGYWSGGVRGAGGGGGGGGSNYSSGTSTTITNCYSSDQGYVKIYY